MSGSVTSSSSVCSAGRMASRSGLCSQSEAVSRARPVTEIISLRSCAQVQRIERKPCISSSLNRRCLRALHSAGDSEWRAGLLADAGVFFIAYFVAGWTSYNARIYAGRASGNTRRQTMGWKPHTSTSSGQL